MAKRKRAARMGARTLHRRKMTVETRPVDASEPPKPPSSEVAQTEFQVTQIKWTAWKVTRLPGESLSSVPLLDFLYFTRRLQDGFHFWWNFSTWQS